MIRDLQNKKHHHPHSLPSEIEGVRIVVISFRNIAKNLEGCLFISPPPHPTTIFTVPSPIYNAIKNKIVSLVRSSSLLNLICIFSEIIYFFLRLQNRVRDRIFRLSPSTPKGGYWKNEPPAGLRKWSCRTKGTLWNTFLRNVCMKNKGIF